MDAQPTIFVVDDDPGVSRALHSVARLLDLPVASYASADEFLANYDPAARGCLVLDIKMPGTTGIELQRRLADSGAPIPVIMISGHADVPIAVEVMSRGAMTLLEKPFRLDELTAHIRKALRLDDARRATLDEQAKTESRLAQLTIKERGGVRPGRQRQDKQRDRGLPEHQHSRRRRSPFASDAKARRSQCC